MLGQMGQGSSLPLNVSAARRQLEELEQGYHTGKPRSTTLADVSAVLTLIQAVLLIFKLLDELIADEEDIEDDS